MFLLQDQPASIGRRVDQLCHRSMCANFTSIPVLQVRSHLVESSEQCPRERGPRNCGGAMPKMANKP